MQIIYRIINKANHHDDWLYELKNNNGVYYWGWLQLDGKNNTTYPIIHLCPTERGSIGNFGNSLMPKIPCRESDFEHH